MRVLGIDPGTGRCGFGVVEKHGTTITPVNYGVIETYKDQSDLERLNIVYEGIAELIATDRPAFMGVETLYFNTHDAGSAFQFPFAVHPPARRTPFSRRRACIRCVR